MKLLNPTVADDGIELHPRRVQMKVRNRIYPLEDRSETFPSIIPSEFGKLVDSISTTLPAWNVADADKLAIYKRFNESVELLNTLRAQFVDFINAVFACNTIIRSQWMKSQQKHDVMMKRSDRWSSLLNAFRASRPSVLRVDLHCETPGRILYELQHALRKEAEELVLSLFNVLDSAVGLEHVGLINWSAEDACRFHYFLYEAIDEVVSESQSVQGERTEETSTSSRRFQTVAKEKRFRTTFRNTRCMHEVINARNFAYPASHVPCPDRVTELLGKVPEFLRPMIRIVTGTEVYRLTIARDVDHASRSETEYEDVLFSEVPRFHPDPAVTIGWFVLTGWGEEEVNVRT